MSDTALADLRVIAQRVNCVARSVLEKEGEHPAMYFLPAERGELQGYVFADTETRPVGEARGLELAEAVETTGAGVVVCVTEAWKAPTASVPAGGGVGDAVDARDVLLVVAVDRHGNSVAIDTPVSRLQEGHVELGDSEEHADYVLNFLSPVRAVWGLES